MKVKLSVIFCLCSFFVLVLGSCNESTTSSSTSTSNPNSHSHAAELFQGIGKYFQAACDDRNRELEKSHEELKEKVESLSKMLEELRRDISEDSGVWLLTPPLRGPPGPKGDHGPLDPRSLKSCSDIMEIYPRPLSPNQTIYPRGRSTETLQVLCDFENDVDGGGWTVIQKRSSGPREEFHRTWSEYVEGFGSLDGNFWIGLDNIRALTIKEDQELRIDLEDFEGNKAYAKYSSFSISDASDFYRLSIGGFYGDSTAGDSMTDLNSGMRFSTKDKDNDEDSSLNCAEHYYGGAAGGWWYSDCSSSFLNGRYREKGETVLANQGIIWSGWKGTEESLAKTEMKIRKRQ